MNIYKKHNIKEYIKIRKFKKSLLSSKEKSIRKEKITIYKLLKSMINWFNDIIEIEKNEDAQYILFKPDSDLKEMIGKERFESLLYERKFEKFRIKRWLNILNNLNINNINQY